VLIPKEDYGAAFLKEEGFIKVPHEQRERKAD
jgi:hypothetical protein